MSARDIAVLVEIHQEKIAPITFELLGCARALAETAGGDVIAFLLGGHVGALGGSLAAADRIIAVEDPALAGFSPEPFLSVLENLLQAETPRLMLLGSTTIGLDLASLLGARISAPVVTGCASLQFEGERLTAMSHLYAGKMCAEVEVTRLPAICVMLPGSYRERKDGGRGQVESRPCEAPLAAGAITFEKMILPEAGDIDITQQAILVAVGRGIKQQENIELAEELAEALGGAVCASRPVVDQGWLPSTRQVGKSGMTVKPKCYLALGVSGAPEHQEGMKNAHLIVAINSDPKAPIYDIAHYGAVVDLMDLVPVLTERIKAKKSV